jgi:pilus assembly protein CpaB
MKPAKLAVLGVSVAAMGGAMYFAQRPPAPVQVIEQAAPAAPQIETEEVLVLKVDGPMGATIRPEDLGWETWPRDSVSPVLITRSNAPPDVEKEIAGSLIRHPIYANEPIRREKLIQTNGTGFMSAILPSGKRAVAIAVEGSGADVAGGFILPNDRVDIIRTFRDESTGQQVSDTLLTNIRVLAIGQSIKEEDGRTTIIAGNATLELDPKQVEIVSLAQRTAKLSLALRALVDNNATEEPTPELLDDGMTIVRFGNAQKIGGN